MALIIDSYSRRDSKMERSSIPFFVFFREMVFRTYMPVLDAKLEQDASVRLLDKQVPSRHSLVERHLEQLRCLCFAFVFLYVVYVMWLLRT